jgi:hypothetical protein
VGEKLGDRRHGPRVLLRDLLDHAGPRHVDEVVLPGDPLAVQAVTMVRFGGDGVRLEMSVESSPNAVPHRKNRRLGNVWQGAELNHRLPTQHAFASE